MFGKGRCFEMYVMLSINCHPRIKPGAGSELVSGSIHRDNYLELRQERMAFHLLGRTTNRAWILKQVQDDKQSEEFFCEQYKEMTQEEYRVIVLCVVSTV